MEGRQKIRERFFTIEGSGGSSPEILRLRPIICIFHAPDIDGWRMGGMKGIWGEESEQKTVEGDWTL